MWIIYATSLSTLEASDSKHHLLIIFSDPFQRMAQDNKTYGYNIATWELTETISSLFYHASSNQAVHPIKSQLLWNAITHYSWAPYLIRRYILKHLSLRNAQGDAYNRCHFWNNFEIVKLSFLRSQAYRDFFHHIDEAGGIYYERVSPPRRSLPTIVQRDLTISKWGDAPIRTLAVSMLLSPSEIHHFADIGYRHDTFQVCPDGDHGCRCQCHPTALVPQSVCINRFRKASGWLEY